MYVRGFQLFDKITQTLKDYFKNKFLFRKMFNVMP